jgi:hypothetical protein
MEAIEKRMSRSSNRSGRPRPWLLVALLASVGCGADNPDLVPVAGIVTMKGRPVAEVIVTFTPTGKTIGNGALGGTDTKGHFALMDVRGGQGAYPGEYKVSLYPTPTSATAGLPTDVVSSGSAGIPAIILDPNNTPLRATVPASGAEVEVALTASGEGSIVNVKPVASGD